MTTNPFLSGVIEGFYGAPWSQAERLQLFERMQEWKLDTYVYAPKDDLKHRALWRENYDEREASTLGELVRACAQRGIRFVYALSPGLDLRAGAPAEVEAVQRRFAQMLDLGCQRFALLFDDIPDHLDAATQAAMANAIFRWLREREPAGRLWFCPTPYCGRMAARGLGGAGYLDILGRELAPEIDVFWTGPEIVSREITVAHVREVAARLRRPPLIWDNLFANDYDGRRFFCGPYAGRPLELRGEVRGLLVNPNCEAALNHVPLRTLGNFANRSTNGTWDTRAEYLSALRAWWPSFATVGAPLAWEEFVWFADCYYLPHEDGAEAEAFARELAAALAAKPAEAMRARVARLQDFCTRLTELRDRALFHALSRRAWELKEELFLLQTYLAAPERAVASDFHLPGTYRGGFASRLQRLLAPQADGSFAPP